MTPTWLLVWGGGDLTADDVAAAVTAVTTSDARAHDLFFSQPDGPRDALLLVHWTAEERDKVLEAIKPRWGGGFVNEVHDLADEQPSTRPAI